MFHDRTIRLEQAKNLLRYHMPLYSPVEHSLFKSFTIIVQIPTVNHMPPITQKEMTALYTSCSHKPPVFTLTPVSEDEPELK